MAENAYLDSGSYSDTESLSQEALTREQDRLLPIANVSRIMKRALPANAKVSKDAKETVQECVSEFISFITGEASDRCRSEKRKTINGDDLLWGISTLGFEDYIGPLKVYLQRFREMEGEKNSMARQAEHASAKDGPGSHGIATGIPSSSLLMQQAFGAAEQGFAYGNPPFYHLRYNNPEENAIARRSPQQPPHQPTSARISPQQDGSAQNGLQPAGAAQSRSWKNATSWSIP